GHVHEYDRDIPGRLQQRPDGHAAGRQDHVGRQRDKFRSVAAADVWIDRAPSGIELYVASDGPTQLLQRLEEGGIAGLCHRVVRGQGGLNADPLYPLRSLRARRERPRSRRAAEQRDELPALHVWMAPVWQEIIWRAAQRSLAVMCPACWCSPGGLLA